MAENKVRPFIVPIFVPFAGCPHRCVFCEQETITSTPRGPITGKDVSRILNEAVGSKNFRRHRNREVAFYGGTFTGLPLSQMRNLLAAVSSYGKQGLFQGVRVSTRPDAVDERRLDLLAHYGVRTVELGAQSMDDEVLSLSQRGHTAQDTAKAVEVLKRKNFEVGIQLMPGLPGDSPERFQRTIDQVIGLAPSVVRLYPALVIRGTILASWYRAGKYEPPSLEEAVNACVESTLRLEEADISVIRIGLMSSPDLLAEGRIVAGPWHPSFGFLVRCGMYHKAIDPQLPAPGEFERIRLRVPPRKIPLVRGFRNEGLALIQAKTGARTVVVEGDGAISQGRISIETI